MRRAVFLDRDGTVIEEVGYLNRLDRVAFFPWSVDAIRVLNEAGLAVVVVTNQAGVARGYFDEALVRDTHARIDLAGDLGIPAMRVFGGGIPGGVSREQATQLLADSLRTVADHAAQRAG